MKVRFGQTQVLKFKIISKICSLLLLTFEIRWSVVAGSARLWSVVGGRWVGCWLSMVSGFVMRYPEKLDEDLFQSKSSWRIYSTHFLQKIWPLQFVNQTKSIKKTVANLDAIGGITLGTKLKTPIFTLYLPHNLQSRLLVFQKFI